MYGCVCIYIQVQLHDTLDVSDIEQQAFIINPGFHSLVRVSTIEVCVVCVSFFA